jgi:cell division transport system permease protein
MKAWLRHHGQACSLALNRLWSAPFNTLLAMLVMGIALAIPAGGAWLLDQAAQWTGASVNPPRMSVFMATTAGAEDTQLIASRLAAHQQVRRTRLIDKQAALAHMRLQWKEALDVLPENPFPDAFELDPTDPSPTGLSRLATEISAWPHVGHVVADTQWAQRSHALIKMGNHLIRLLAALLGLGAAAVVFNTIRLQIMTRRTEIEVSRLLGAPDGWIQRPYFYFGALQGLLGGITAGLLVMLATWWLAQPTAQLAQSYGAALVLAPWGWREFLMLIALSIALGWCASALSLWRHLSDRNYFSKGEQA